MSYRDLIDIPEIDWKSEEERFRLPPHAAAQRVILTPSNAIRGTPRPNASRKPKPPRELADLDHRIPGCQGVWAKSNINKFGHQVVFCWRCKATRIAKREEAK